MRTKVWALLCVVAVAAGAVAQPTADEGLAQRRDLAERYFKAVHIDDTMRRAMASIMPTMIEQATRQTPDLPAGTREAMAEAAQGAAGDLIPKVEARMSEIMAQKFTTEELESILAFYESPVGQKIVEKTAEISSSVGPMMADLMPGVQQDMMRRFCAKVDCSTLPKARQPKT
jgi:hypothetical protein